MKLVLLTLLALSTPWRLALAMNNTTDGNDTTGNTSIPTLSPTLSPTVAPIIPTFVSPSDATNETQSPSAGSGDDDDEKQSLFGFAVPSSPLDPLVEMGEPVVGAIVGGVLLCCVLCCVACCFMRRKRKKKKHKHKHTAAAGAGNVSERNSKGGHRRSRNASRRQSRKLVNANDVAGGSSLPAEFDNEATEGQKIGTINVVWDPNAGADDNLSPRSRGLQRTESAADLNVDVVEWMSDDEDEPVA